MEKEVRITEVGNAYMVYVTVFRDGTNIGETHGKPIAVLNNGGNVDKELGAAVRKALATRVRGPRKEKKAEEVTV